MATIQDIDVNALDALIERLQQAKDYQLTLEPADIELLITALLTLSTLQNKLSDRDITLTKLRKLVGMVSASERLKDLLPLGTDALNEESGPVTSDTDKITKSTRKKKKNIKTTATPPAQVYHALTEQRKGDRCPECDTDTLSKYEPAVMLRISGHSPYEATRHVMERLRCNACGQYFTASLPDDVQQDGGPNQRYGYSARSLMVMNKYYMGQPFFRQETFQQIMGVNITASTLFDQCEYVANALNPVYQVIIRLAADAVTYEIDDTPYQILNETEAQKPNRRTGQLQRRTGSNASGLIATLTEGQILILIQTNIGHAGEWIDKILHDRTDTLDPPLLMSDALSSNKPTVTDVLHCLCNVHARRKFADLTEHFPEASKWVLKNYALVWKNESDCQQQELPPAERKAYHHKHSLPVMDSMKKRFEIHLADEEVEENSGLGKAMRYFLNHYNGLVQFCHTPNARLDNNRMETTLKIPIRNRKNAFFYKTQAGADVADILISIVATCVQGGINPLDYLTWIQQHSAQVKGSPKTCLPWNYQ